VRWARVVCVGAIALATACANAAQPEPTGTFHTAPLRVQTITPSPTPAGSRTPQVLSGNVTVDVGDQFFLPEQLFVTVGTTVTWVNRGQLTHSVVARGGAWVSGTMEFGKTYAFTFTKAGRYAYFCQQHTDMIGEVNVVGGG